MALELNIWIALLVFSISLPIAVMSGAALLGLQDTESRVAGLLRLLVCSALLLALLLLLGTDYVTAILLAFALVTTLHLTAYWGLRWWIRSNNKT